LTVEEWLGKDNIIGHNIWYKKYQYNNESFDEWLIRVSGGNEDVKRLIIEKKFLFGGRILSNRGLDKMGVKTTMSNCYVMEPPSDSIESIYETAAKLARTYSYGGGCGIDISKLRPRGATVGNAAKETSGAVSFMDLYSNTTELIGQNGRRGALMISLSCDHPDLEEFIEVKSDLNRVTKANISIRITDKFMEAVSKKEKYVLNFTVEETGQVITKEVDAYEVFHKICKMNWDYGEPGMLFWDIIEEWNLLSDNEEFQYAGTNPCAEEPLPAGGSCLLGSINLSEFVMPNGIFDFNDFVGTVKVAVTALNDILDEGLPLHPLAEQRDSVKKWRQIGLGIFGLADMLIKMKLKYGSKESLDICSRIAHVLINNAVSQSSELAGTKNKVFEGFDYDSVKSTAFYMGNIISTTDKKVKQNGLLNSQLLTIAPTGSISTMLGVSGGIEPIYANYYLRKTESLHGHDKFYKVYTQIVKEYMEEHGLTKEEELPDYFVTAQTLKYMDRIDMQAVWQFCIDASISSTINVPNDFTVEQVEDMYMWAWEKGLKGVTLFRDGCKRSGVLTTTTETKEDSKIPDKEKAELPRGYIIQVDDNVIGKKRKLITGCGSLHCVAFFDPNTGSLLETYLSKGSIGGCQSNLTAVSRLMSLSARSGADAFAIADQLKSCMACPSYAVRSATKQDTSKGSSCPVAIGNALIDMCKEMQSELFEDDANQTFDKNLDKTNKETKENLCPECDAGLVYEGGCVTCKACGYSKCD